MRGDTWGPMQPRPYFPLGEWLPQPPLGGGGVSHWRALICGGSVAKTNRLYDCSGRPEARCNGEMVEPGAAGGDDDFASRRR